MRIIGFGLDNQDGHQRVTRADAYALFSGSERSHEEMQTLCARLEAALAARGLTLEQANPAQLERMIRDIVAEP